MTDADRAELEALRADKAARAETARARVAAMAKARRIIRPCPACQRPSTARERRKGCGCGYRWPVRDR